MKIRNISSAVVAALVSVSAFAQGEVVVKDRLSSLPAGNVRFTGYFDNDIHNSLEHWTKETVPHSKLVDFYRNGRPDKNKFALGEMPGKTIRAAVLFYDYTKDPELKEIARTDVYDLLSTKQSNGNISCTPVEDQPGRRDGDIWERKYTLLGLIQYYQDIEQSPEVLETIVRMADLIVEQVGPESEIDINATGWSSNHIETDSVLEPMMKIYFLTGDMKYLDFAQYLISKGGCRGADIFKEITQNVPMYKTTNSRYPKAYEMTSVMEGAAEYYRATGDTAIFTVLKNFYTNVKNNEITIIGNGGADQPYYYKFRGEAWDNTYYEQANPRIERMMETCVGVTWMKFLTSYARLTGDPEAIDYIEKYAYNGLLGAMRLDGCGFSYVNLLNGRKVTNSGWGTTIDGQPVTCCNLSGPIGLGFLPQIAVMQASNGPVINLYNSCEAVAKSYWGRDVKLSIQTEYPRSGHIVINVDPKKKENFSIWLRIPGWCRKGNIQVYEANGKNAVGKMWESSKGKSDYYAIEKKWKKGDRIVIDFEMEAFLVDAPKGDDPKATYDFQAVQYGPIVLARDENTDPDFDKPVQVIATKGENLVNVKAVAPTLSTTRMEFLVPTTNGDIRMIDYSSVNGWEGKRIQTWMPVLREN